MSDEKPIFLDLEPMICDALSMSLIASNLVDEVFQEEEKGNPDHYFISLPAREQVEFATSHVIDLLKAIKTLYYAVHKAQGGDADAPETDKAA